MPDEVNTTEGLVKVTIGSYFLLLTPAEAADVAALIREVEEEEDETSGRG